MAKYQSLLGAHHDFDVATAGVITCRDCGRRYTLSSVWQAEIDPCSDGIPTGVSEDQAKANQARVLELLGFPAGG